ncbi:homoprotocatechuate degradation operon regulator HpaR [Duganella sp. FT3S]|uniref:Homoprotocatechuate degradation operon regulator HpaR n=1 Tax=Rugamonas fusca TaxID=2758568 RepID=A0A7W2EI12_9BURK|nr:homoprotocatechuate degradation operon regulator HpaR [Rugamonas fusca]MBA5606209.1 homoprotocatechuate degradation operon regulator HpaR [Rugamonas fusca]
MNNPIPFRDLPQLIGRTRESLMQYFRPLLHQFGISEQQWRILRGLAEHGELEPRELCQQCGMLSASMAGVLARMEKSGLVVRRPVAGDKRRVMVGLAAHGSEVVKQMLPLVMRQYEHIEEAFGAQRFQALVDLCEAFVELDAKVGVRSVIRTQR